VCPERALRLPLRRNATWLHEHEHEHEHEIGAITPEDVMNPQTLWRDAREG